MDARHSALRLSLVMALSSGCMAGPNYKKPAVPDAFRRTEVPRRNRRSRRMSPPTSQRSVMQKWWDAFQDDALRDLIRAALQQNYDVRIAAARILEARALLGIARADQLPEVNAVASVANERSPEVGRAPARRDEPGADHGRHSPGSSISGASFDAPRSLLAPAFCRKSGHSVKSSVRSSAMWRPPISSCANRTSNSRSRAGRSRRGETRCG